MLDTHLILRPILKNNPLTTSVLGVCSALAITNSLANALIMSLSLTTVLILSSLVISLVRNSLPSGVRLIIQITIIASLVTVIDQVLKALVPEIATRLTVYVSLIVTNCIVLGRAEACAMNERPLVSVADALGNGLGYSLILIVVATLRELIGTGSLLGIEIFPTIRHGGWFPENALVMLAPSAFFIIGMLIWGIRSVYPEQQERLDFEPVSLPSEEAG